MGAGKGEGNVVWSIIWLLILIFIGFWIACFCAGWYILFQPFSVCIEGCGPVQEILLKGVNFPRLCAEAMMGGKTFAEVTGS